jgi:hypothetical protein
MRPRKDALPRVAAWYVSKMILACGQGTVQHAPGSFDCYTLQEAVLAWHRRPAKDREQATIKVNVPGGPVYTAREIERLHYGPKPAA